MRSTRLWRGLLGLDERTVIEDVELIELDDDADDESEMLVVAHVRPRRRGRARCGRCGARAVWYDRGGRRRRRWRGLDLGTLRVWLEADAPRVSCPAHGPTVIEVPWARHDAGHTYGFDDTVAWLAVHTSKSAVSGLMRIAWRTVGSIITRVWDDTDTLHDRFAGLIRIGIDEISYKKGRLYLTVVVDHDTGRLVWAAPGQDKATLRGFFDELGDERAQQITHVSSDEAKWIIAVVNERCPNAVRCADPFHVVTWATDALDVERRRAWNQAKAIARTEPKRHRGRPAADAPARPGHDRVTQLQRARYALWKNPEDLTCKQQAKIEWIAATDPRLHRAYLLKEALRHVFKIKGEEGKQALDRWLAWAQRSRIDAFVALGRKIKRHREAINAALDHGLSQGLVESLNTKIRLLTRIAFGFRSAHALIALAMLSLGGHRPTLPGR